jgi:transcription elongation factor Elf1
MSETLDAWNKRRRRQWEIEDMRKPHRNDLTCPSCGEELWDTDPMVTLASFPPQKAVHCPACGYRGYRLA